MPRFVERWVWAIRVGWRVINGRWYNFRDVPAWYVAEMSRIPEDAADPAVRATGEQARAELKHRADNLKFRAAREAAKADPL